MNKCELGINAIDFIQIHIDSMDWKNIDLVIFDPPYYDSDDPIHQYRFGTGVKREASNKTKYRFRDSLHTVLMDSKERAQILETIKLNMVNGFILYFHSKPHYRDSLKFELIWYKKRPSFTGGIVSPNHEFMYLEEIGEAKLNRYMNLPYVNQFENNVFDGKRTAMKPLALFDHFYKVLETKCVFDPFAGFGNSIQAAINRGISIYACDLDTSLQSRWDGILNQTTLGEAFSFV